MYLGDLEAVLRKTREIVHEVVAVNAEAVDREATWPEQNIRALQTAGLGGLVVRRAYGGSNQGLLALAQVCELLGRECASTAICFGMHCVGASVISANPTPYQKEQYLEPICQGQHFTTLSLSEPGTGAHFYFPQTKLETAQPDGFRITGTKTFVTNGGYADSYVVSAVAADPEAPMGQFSCVVVPREADGMAWGSPWAGLGMRGNSSRSLELRGVKVPPGDLLGKEGDQIWYIFNVVCPYFLIAMAGTYLGIASSAVEEVCKHLTKRHHSHSGLALAQSPVLQHRLGELWGVVERTRRLVYFAASSVDAGDPDAFTVVMSAKAEVADCVVNVVNEAMTLMGGIAYRDGSRLHRFLRDARASHLMSPTTDILRIWIGRALLGQPLLSD
jgi:alkylation response protein AidB-like acyl-CoA dehydrogenase